MDYECPCDECNGNIDPFTIMDGMRRFELTNRLHDLDVPVAEEGPFSGFGIDVDTLKELLTPEEFEAFSDWMLSLIHI